MKFSLLSDLHVNHPQPKMRYDLLEEIVVVAGDTSNGLEGLRFLQKLKNKGHRVLAVDGNHEHYSNLNQGRTIDETTQRFASEFPTFYSSFEDDAAFILRNGWYFVHNEQAWFHYMNDGRYADAGGNAVSIRAKQDARAVRRLLEYCEESGRAAVVVTHTAPCLETLNPVFDGHFSNEWYWNPDMRPLLGEFKDTILVWCHGHTHAPADVVVDGVRVVCNPRGYPGENPDWKPITIEV